MSYWGRYITPKGAKAIIRRVAEENGVGIRDIIGRNKARRASRPRQQVYAELHDAGAPLAHIGRLMHRDHSTIIYGVRAHRERVGANG